VTRRLQPIDVEAAHPAIVESLPERARRHLARRRTL
jgi:hypothetical protein